MRHVVILGADGFIGRGLVRRLLEEGSENLTLLDRSFAEPATDTRVRQVAGDLTDATYLAQALAQPVDLLFHLASLPGAAAERQPHLGRAINLDTPLALLALLERQVTPARVVLASSIAVYGALGGPVTEDAPCAPQISYGAHKWMTEIALADAARRGVIDGRSLRLPGIVARPAAETGHGSAFMSQIFHRIRAGQDYVLPVGLEAACWWMSRQTCIDNLLHAARFDDISAARVWQLPVLHLTVAAVVAAMQDRYGRAAQITAQPDPALQRLFGAMPALHTPRALAAGFRADADVAALIRAAYAP